MPTHLVDNTSIDCLKSSNSRLIALKSEFSETDRSSRPTSETEDLCGRVIATSDVETIPQEVLKERTDHITRSVFGKPASSGHAGMFAILSKSTNFPHFTVLSATRSDGEDQTDPLLPSSKPLTFDSIPSFSQHLRTFPTTSAPKVENLFIYPSDSPGILTSRSTTTPSAISKHNRVVTSTKVQPLTSVLKGSLTLNRKLQNTEPLQGNRQTSKTMGITQSPLNFGGDIRKSTEHKGLFISASHPEVTDIFRPGKQGFKQNDSLLNTVSDSFKAERSDKDALFQSKDGYKFTSMYATTGGDVVETNALNNKGSPHRPTTGARQPVINSTADARTILGIEIPGMTTTHGESHPFDDNGTQSHNITQWKVDNVTDGLDEGFGEYESVRPLGVVAGYVQ